MSASGRCKGRPIGRGRVFLSEERLVFFIYTKLAINRAKLVDSCVLRLKIGNCGIFPQHTGPILYRLSRPFNNVKISWNSSLQGLNRFCIFQPKKFICGTMNGTVHISCFYFISLSIPIVLCSRESPQDILFRFNSGSNSIILQTGQIHLFFLHLT